MKTYFRVLTYAKPLGWLAPQYLIYALFQTVFSVITLGVLTPVLNVLFMVETDAAEIPESIPDFYLGLQYFKDVFNYYFLDLVQEDRFLALQFVCGILIVSIFLSNLFKYLLAVISAIVRANVISNLRNALYDRLINMHIGYYTEERKGNIMSKVMADVQEVENTVVNSLKVVVKEPLMLIGYFVALFFISAKLTGITLIILPLSGFIISYIAISIKKRAIKSQETIGNISNILEETIGGMRIIKAFNAILFSKKRFEGEVDVYAKVNVSMQKRQALSSPTSEFLGVFVVVAVLLIGGSMILGGESELSAGSFITFIAIYSQLLVPAKALSTAFSNVQRGLASAERIFGIIDLEPAIKDKSTAKKLVEFKRELSFKNVSFAYGEEKVLNNININIQKGETIALVGPSGGGKSTMADLIPRFYDPIEGEVQIDGVSLKDLRVESIREKMGIVSQESILFNDTIFNNIAFGKPECTLEEVMQAAKVANAHEFISQMEGGYEAKMGERGTKLSGGQRQRISIARAILKNPDILILDEATSALDSESEKLVQDALTNLMKNRTSIVIAHRLSTIQEADKIFVMQEGEIIEEGQHDDLMAKGGVYKKLIEIQSVS
ncbi:antibiotic ABC transporter ATP-binding protein [Marivirga tractuosa]|uniref:ABC transporter related protein n=1 Tax=Marivirga tractuosa (strain ATCC 23168 / DSM 4126 / NBRC 15989 / NCIMB 1408 / VKM B-1430 / H-43) TaxID=643867 RepID=E4TPN5_MARTH|nr:ABC transporter ATP-binding protein [Marivirga tractuosa]ADR22599.1 ABC transporter related protein [Marivirga tractuosa DSM 4126]BDD16730.1 antibiotic ABC transporter ATP-binding protein [Marivirga tractuosa]